MLACLNCSDTRRIAKGGVPWCTLCRSESVETLEFFLVECMMPSPEAQDLLRQWQRAFAGVAPGAAALRTRTRSALSANRIMSGDSLAMAMLASDKAYLDIDMIVNRFKSSVRRMTQDQLISEIVITEL